MKTSLRSRLALSYLLVILIGMGIAAPLAWLAVEGLYQDSQRSSLLAQAKLVAAALQSEAPLTGEGGSYSQTSNTLPGIHTRIIDAQGAVVIDLNGIANLPTSTGLVLPQLAQNAAGLVTPEELTSRPEIIQAMQGQPSTIIRRVEVAGGKQVLYAAAPIFSKVGKVIQVIYLATPLPDTQWTALPEGIRWQLGAALLIAIIIAGAAGLLLTRRITGPLVQLSRAAQAVAKGNLAQTVPEDPTISELNELGQSFNAMTASLRQSDLAKTAFISDVSHELQTPLTVIKGTIETLQDGALDDRKARGPLMAAMEQETDRLIRLVKDLLVLTRADAGALKLQLQPVDLRSLAHSRCDLLNRLASLQNIKLRIADCPDQASAPQDQVLADPDRIAQVLDNLLENSIRYSTPGSEVTVSISKEGNLIACSIGDTGLGIPERHLPYIFDRFYRVDPARGRGKGGSGLGLSIVRSLVEAQHGKVSATSKEGIGTTITFWLPAAIPT